MQDILACFTLSMLFYDTHRVTTQTSELSDWIVLIVFLLFSLRSPYLWIKLNKGALGLFRIRSYGIYRTSLYSSLVVRYYLLATSRLYCSVNLSSLTSTLPRIILLEWSFCNHIIHHKLRQHHEDIVQMITWASSPVSPGKTRQNVALHPPLQTTPSSDPLLCAKERWTNPTHARLPIC
jgi:hypothetical protein